MAPEAVGAPGLRSVMAGPPDFFFVFAAAFGFASALAFAAGAGFSALAFWQPQASWPWSALGRRLSSRGPLSSPSRPSWAQELFWQRSSWPLLPFLSPTSPWLSALPLLSSTSCQPLPQVSGRLCPPLSSAFWPQSSFCSTLAPSILQDEPALALDVRDTHGRVFPGPAGIAEAQRQWNILPLAHLQLIDQWLKLGV